MWFSTSRKDETLEPVFAYCRVTLSQWAHAWEITYFNHLTDDELTHDEVFAKVDSNVKQIRSEQSASEEERKLKREENIITNRSPRMQIKQDRVINEGRDTCILNNIKKM